MKRVLNLALGLLLVFGQSVKADPNTPMLVPLPTYYRLNTVPTLEMDAATEYVRKMMVQLMQVSPADWISFRQKHFLQRAELVLPFYNNRRDTLTVEEKQLTANMHVLSGEFAIILDYVYLYNNVNRLPKTRSNQELKRALTNLIGNKFFSINTFMEENYMFRTNAVEPTLGMLTVFAKTLKEAVNDFDPPLEIKDLLLRDTLVEYLNLIYTGILKREFLGDNYKDLKKQHRKIVKENIKIIQKELRPPLVDRIKNKFSSYEEEVISCEVLFGGSN